MLKGSKYEDIDIVRCIVVLLKSDEYEEYKVPMDVITETMSMDINTILNKDKSND